MSIKPYALDTIVSLVRLIQVNSFVLKFVKWHSRISSKVFAFISFFSGYIVNEAKIHYHWNKMGKIQIVEDAFGYMENPITGEGANVKRFTFSNDDGVSVQVITYGATITSLRCPDKYGNIADIVLGFDELEGKTNFFFFGCIAIKIIIININWENGTF